MRIRRHAESRLVELALTSALSSPRAQKDPEARERLAAATKDRAAWIALHPEKRAELFREFPEHMRMFRDYYGNPDENRLLEAARLLHRRIHPRDEGRPDDVRQRLV